MRSWTRPALTRQSFVRPSGVHTIGRQNTSHTWLRSTLALLSRTYLHSDRYARDNWEDYVAAHWLKRADFYAEIPNSRVPMSDAAFDRTLVEGMGLERDLLQSLGFTLLDLEGNAWAFRRIATDDLCKECVKRALSEADFRDAR